MFNPRNAKFGPQSGSSFISRSFGKRRLNAPDRELPFEPSEGAPEAHVRVASKRQVAVVCAPQIEPIRITILPRITVGGADHERDRRPGGQLTAVDRKIGLDHSPERLHRAFVSKQLFDGRRQQGLIAAQFRVRVGMLQQRVIPLPIRLRVVSWPPNSSMTHCAYSSSSVITPASSAASSSRLSRSFLRAPLRSRMVCEK